MKLVAVILSVYIMILTAMPCADVIISDTNAVTIELSDINHHQTHEGDLCTPFCFCNCCQTLSQTTMFNTTQVTFAGFDLESTVLIQNEMECAISFWRPPKS